MSDLGKILALAGLLGLLTACGFRPMYAENSQGVGLQDTFAEVQISPIPDRLGQTVRNHLLDRINPRGGTASPQYRLNVLLDKTVEGFGFRQDEAITRESMTLEGDFELIDLDTGKVVFSDSVRAVHAYDVVQSDFANFSAQQDAEKRTAELVSDLITARLGMYFKSAE